MCTNVVLGHSVVPILVIIDLAELRWIPIRLFIISIMKVIDALVAFKNGEPFDLFFGQRFGIWNIHHFSLAIKCPSMKWTIQTHSKLDKVWPQILHLIYQLKQSSFTVPPKPKLAPRWGQYASNKCAFPCESLHNANCRPTNLSIWKFQPKSNLTHSPIGLGLASIPTSTRSQTSHWDKAAGNSQFVARVTTSLPQVLVIASTLAQTERFQVRENISKVEGTIYRSKSPMPVPQQIDSKPKEEDWKEATPAKKKEKKKKRKGSLTKTK